MSTTGSSGDNNSQPDSPRLAPAQSSQIAKSVTRACKPRTQTKWPEVRVAITGIDDEGWPVPQAVRDRFVLVCGLIARERVSVNVKLKSIPMETKEIDLFPILEHKLEYPGNLSRADHQKAIRSAMKEIGLLHKSHLRTSFMRPESHPLRNIDF